MDRLEDLYRDLLEHLKTADLVVLTTHLSPDGDGIGSQIALAKLIDNFDVEVRIINRDPAPPELDFIDPTGRIEIYRPERHDEKILTANLVICVDNSAPQRLGEMRGPIERSAGITVTFDHHPQPDPFWRKRVVDETASCTGEMVYRLQEESGFPMCLEAARAIYVALVGDTGRFRFGNTNARALKLAVDLVEIGVQPAAVHTLLDERKSLGYLRLLGESLKELEVLCRGRLVVLNVTAEQIERTGARPGDTSEIINEALRLEGSCVAALFRQSGSAETKISLRSKRSLDVNALARRFGGGGHRNASGMVLDCGMEEARRSLLPLLEELVSESNSS